MNNKTIFFADIDGTLLGAEFLLGEEVIRAAKNYQEAGGKLVLCTGRSVYGTKHIAHRLGSLAPAILYNGAVIYDFQREKILWKRPMDKKIMERVRCIYQSVWYFLRRRPYTASEQTGWRKTGEFPKKEESCILRYRKSERIF